MEYELLEPIDFSAKNAARDAHATNVEVLKNAAYDESSRGTMAFFAFYRPIVEEYVDEFADMNPFFPEERKKDLFWLVMRHAFALLRTYEHKGYGSFRNLLRTLVNFNALKSDDRMAYMKDSGLAQRDTRECQFVDLALQYLVVRENPERFAMSRTIRAFMFHPERLARLPEEALPAVEAEIDAFEREIDRAYDRFARASASKGTLEALAPIIGEERWARLVRHGTAPDGPMQFGDSLFGCLREDPAWFGLPAGFFEDDGDDGEAAAGA